MLDVWNYLRWKGIPWYSHTFSVIWKYQNYRKCMEKLSFSQNWSRTCTPDLRCSFFELVRYFFHIRSIKYMNSGRIHIFKKRLKFEKKRDFGGNLCHVRHCPRKFFLTLENLLSRKKKLPISSQRHQQVNPKLLRFLCLLPRRQVTLKCFHVTKSFLGRVFTFRLFYETLSFFSAVSVNSFVTR